MNSRTSPENLIFFQFAAQFEKSQSFPLIANKNHCNEINPIINWLFSKDPDFALSFLLFIFRAKHSLHVT